MSNRKELVKQLIKEFDLKDTKDISEMFKELVGNTIEEMLNSELDENLGFERYDQSAKSTSNSRNGFSEKSVRSDFGDISIKVPRDRQGDFEPQIVKKHQKDLGSIEQQITLIYPEAIVQRCIVHQIRNSTRYVSYKDIKEFMKDLKMVYQASTIELAEMNLDKLEEKWNGKYPSSIKSWRENWSELSAYFNYPKEIRKMIYTTNAIENFNRQLRKVTKTKSTYPSEDALLKSLY